MMKTAMQQLIEQLENVLKDGVVISADEVINAAIGSAKQLLSIEKEQLGEMYDRGWDEGYERRAKIDE